MNNVDELLPSDLTNVKTLRDEFAMSALTGTMSSGFVYTDDAEIAKDCYEIADAMLAERSKTNDSAR